jgi:uncharacterized protein YgiM (DUF1202 family)
MLTRVPRFLSFVAIATMLAAVPSAPPYLAAAQDDEVLPAAQNDGIVNVGDRAVVFDGPVNLRIGAGTGNPVLTVLPQGEEMDVLAGPVAATGYNWFQVDPDSAAVGWIAGAFIEEVGFDVGDFVFVNTDALNVRSAPGTASSVLGVMLTDAVGEVLDGPQTASGYIWYRVAFDGGLTGWAAAVYLSLSLLPPIDIPYDDGAWLFVFDPPLNLRSAAGLGGPVIATLDDGEGMKVVSGPVELNGYDWYQVESEAGQGWIASDFVTGGFKAPGEAVVADGPLNLRQSSTTQSAILEVLAEGETVEVQAGAAVIAGGYWWFQVESEGNTMGWVAGRYLGRA